MPSSVSDLPPDILASELRKIEERAVSKLKARFQLSLQELTFTGLLFDCPSFPVHLEVRRAKLKLAAFFRKPFKQEAWVEYMRLVSERVDGYVGIVFRSGDVQGRLLILHNRWCAPAVSGRLRIVLRAKDEGQGSLLEEYDDFMESVAMDWSP